MERSSSSRALLVSASRAVTPRGPGMPALRRQQRALSSAWPPRRSRSPAPGARISASCGCPSYRRSPGLAVRDHHLLVLARRALITARSEVGCARRLVRQRAWVVAPTRSRKQRHDRKKRTPIVAHENPGKTRRAFCHAPAPASPRNQHPRSRDPTVALRRAGADRAETTASNPAARRRRFESTTRAALGDQRIDNPREARALLAHRLQMHEQLGLRSCCAPTPAAARGRMSAGVMRPASSASIRSPSPCTMRSVELLNASRSETPT